LVDSLFIYQRAFKYRGYVAVNGGSFENDELKSVWYEAVVVYFKVLLQQQTEVNEETHDRYDSR
jgi:hypothetical protein